LKTVIKSEPFINERIRLVANLKSSKTFSLSAARDSGGYHGF
jgi:hypothetical protein